jgi:hypothetical protein
MLRLRYLVVRDYGGLTGMARYALDLRRDRRRGE